LQENREMPRHKSIWDGCKQTEEEFQRITRKQSSGIDLQENREIPRHKSIRDG